MNYSKVIDVNAWNNEIEILYDNGKSEVLPYSDVNYIKVLKEAIVSHRELFNKHFKIADMLDRKLKEIIARGGKK